MLDSNILEQVKGVFASLSSDITLSVTRNSNDEKSTEFSSFIEDIASTSDKVKAVYQEGEQFSFSILRNGEETGISFRGIPNGHEFTSLLLAILNSDGQGKNLPDEAIAARIKSLKGKIRLQTYVSLTCTNCPDVVQALNVMALINPNISNEMVDGGLYQDEIQRLNIQGVPSVFLNGEPFHTGRGDLGTLLGKLEDKLGTDHDAEAGGVEHNYDVVVLGGGPAGASAAIYSARKGLRVAVVAERIGGQVNDTTEIANVTSVPKTTGTKLAADLRTHLNDYPIDIFDNRKVMAVNLQEAVKRVSVRGGETFLAPAVIVATGAKTPIINKNHLQHGKKTLVIDLSIPNNVDKNIKEIDGVTLIDIDGLSSQIQETMEQRRKEIPKAEDIIKLMMKDFLEWEKTRKMVPKIHNFKSILKNIELNEMHNIHKKHRYINVNDMELSDKLIQKITNRFAKYIIEHPWKADEISNMIHEIFVEQPNKEFQQKISRE